MKSSWPGRILVGALLLGACSASRPVEVASQSDSGPPSAPTAAPSDTPDPVFDDQAPISLIAQRQFGNGRAVAVSTFGAETIVATTSGSFRVGPEGRPERIWSELDGDVRDIRASADGRFVALLGRSARVEIVDMGNGAVRTAVLDDVWGADFLADGTLVAWSFSAVRMMTAVDGVVRAEFAPAAGRTIADVVTVDDVVQVLVESDGADELITWDGGAPAAPKPLDIPEGLTVERIVADPISNRIGVGAVDRFDGSRASIRVFDASSAELLYAVDAGVEAAAPTWVVLPDGGLFAARDASFDVLGPDGVGSAGGELPGVVEYAIPLRDASGVVSGDVATMFDDGAIARVSPDGVVSPIDRHGDRVAHVGTNVHGAAVVDAVGRVDRLASDGSIIAVSDAFMGGVVNDVAVSMSGEAATASSNGLVTLLGDVNNEDLEPTELQHTEGKVGAVAFSPDGGQVVTGVAQRRSGTAYDDTVSFWDPELAARGATVGGEVVPTPGCAFFESVVRYAPDGSFVAASTHDFKIRLISTEDASIIHTFEPGGGTVRDFTISADQSTLAATSEDAGLRLYDLVTFELIAEHQLDAGGFWSISFLPDARRLVGGEITGSLRVFDGYDATTSVVFDGVKPREARTAISPDGTLVASGGDNGSVQIWSIGTGALLASAVGHAFNVNTVEFFPEGDRLISGSQDGTAIVWQLSPG